MQHDPYDKPYYRTYATRAGRYCYNRKEWAKWVIKRIWAQGGPNWNPPTKCLGGE